MSEKEINIKSSTIEKGLELAKDFLGKLIFPTVEEVGLLISDNIKFLRFKNQVSILLKARKYIENKGITTKEIPIKILVPLLENASLEENESLQDKWAKMLVNMVDTNTNLQNQIFPYLLSQISIAEYDGLISLLSQERLHFESYKKLNELIKLDDHREKNIFRQNPEIVKLREDVDRKEQEGFLVNLEPFEYSNLERLGLIKRLPPKVIIEEFKTGDDFGESSGERWHQIEAEYDLDTNGYKTTELGEKFIEVCEIKE